MPTKVNIYNQSIGIETDDVRLKEHINRFLKNFYTQDTNQYTKSPYAKPSPDKVFANVSKCETSFIVHRNQFLHLLSYLEQVGYDLSKSDKVDLRNYPVASIDIPVNEGWVPYPKQELAINFLLDPPKYSKLLPMQTGSGKALPLKSKIKVPGGWSTMGKMKVGTVVTAKDGSPCKVTGVYPQGRTRVAKITFEDGRTARCSLEHLWKVYESINYVDYTTEVTTTAELIYRTKKQGRTFSIDLNDSECLAVEEPLLNGIEIVEGVSDSWLLDSSNANRVETAKLLLKYHTYVPNGDLIHLVINSMKEVKYLTYLFRSLGGKVFYAKDLTRSNYKVTICIAWKERFFCDRDGDNSFFSVSPQYHQVKLRIVSIEDEGHDETKCISIDHPEHLFVIDDFIVTHNSLMSMATLSRKGVRAGICILPTYIEKTVGDMTKILNVKAKDIMVIQGSSSLVGLIDMAKEGRFNSPFTIFSSTTMSNFNKGYEDEKEFTLDKYGISPIELIPLLQIGVLLIDETHQHFHIMYKQILNSNVKSLIGMSATFISDDKFISRMHRLIYPDDGIYKDFGHTKYIDIYSIGYSINPNYQRHIKTTEFNSTFYSHTAYEQSIHKIPYLRARYYALVRATLDDYFLTEYKQGDRFVVFVATVVMATELTEYMKEAYPLLDIRRYVEKDPYENLTDPDGRITTVISAGTNKDIKNLRVAVSTISISSSASNLQVIGRLRELPDRDVKFCQLYCEGIKKHHDYRIKRNELFRDKVKAIYERRSSVSV